MILTDYRVKFVPLYSTFTFRHPHCLAILRQPYPVRMQLGERRPLLPTRFPDHPEIQHFKLYDQSGSEIVEWLMTNVSGPAVSGEITHELIMNETVRGYAPAPAYILDLTFLKAEDAMAFRLSFDITE